MLNGQCVYFRQRLSCVAHGSSRAFSVRPRKQNGRIPTNEAFNLRKALEGTERTMLLEALQRTGFNRDKAAKLLGIGRNTLYEKMKRLGIDPQKRGESS